MPVADRLSLSLLSRAVEQTGATIASVKRPTELDPDIGQVALEWAKESLKPEFRGQAFGPEVTVPDDTPLYDRLAAFFGRTP